MTSSTLDADQPLPSGRTSSTTPSGELGPSEESTEVRWVERGELAALEVQPTHRLRIEHGYAEQGEPSYT